MCEVLFRNSYVNSHFLFITKNFAIIPILQIKQLKFELRKSPKFATMVTMRYFNKTYLIEEV